MRSTPVLLFAFALGLAHPSWSQGSAMQVEEPAGRAAPPIDPDLESAHWKARPASPALNRVERAAYEGRRRNVEEMAERIRVKREAVERSGIGDKAARVRDLEDLVLEKDGPKPEGGSGSKRDRLESRLEKKDQVKEKALERKMERLEKRLEKALEKNREKLDKANEDRKEKLKRKGAGN